MVDFFQREAYPRGFFVVLVVKGDDVDCGDIVEGVNPSRRKFVNLLVKSSISKEDFITASVTAFSVGFAFCAFYIIGVVVHNVRKGRKLREQLLSDQQEITDEPVYLQSPSIVEEVGMIFLQKPLRSPIVPIPFFHFPGIVIEEVFLKKNRLMKTYSA